MKTLNKLVNDKEKLFESIDDLIDKFLDKYKFDDYEIRFCKTDSHLTSDMEFTIKIGDTEIKL